MIFAWNKLILHLLYCNFKVYFPTPVQRVCLHPRVLCVTLLTVLSPSLLLWGCVRTVLGGAWCRMITLRLVLSLPTDRGRSCTTIPSTVGLMEEGVGWIVWFCNSVVHLYQCGASSADAWRWRTCGAELAVWACVSFILKVLRWRPSDTGVP